MDISRPRAPATHAHAARIAAAWNDDRRYLLATAAGILRDDDAAEDAVAEAFARLAAQRATIRDVRGWLIVVVRRVALDRLGSAHRRLSEPVDPAEPELDRAAAESVANDPADRVTLDDEIRRALSAVLDWLSPGERAAFLLHDVFGLPFADVGLLVGRSAEACRQLASRARRSIRAAGPRTPATSSPDPQLDPLVERFMAACASGDIDGLAELLHRDVVGWAARGGVVLDEVRGAERVSAQAVSFFGPRSRWRMAGIALDDGTGVLITRNGSPAGMIRLVTSGGLITELQGSLLGG